MDRRLLLAIALPIVLCPQGSSAQDVEMLGRRYGTRPPDAYYEEMARNPTAFQFRHGRAARMREAAAERALRALGVGAPGASRSGPAAGALGPLGGPVVGDFYVPVLLGLFADSPLNPPVLRTAIQDGYFGPQPGTISDYYGEISHDSIALFGDVAEWVRSPMDSASTAQGKSALACCGIGDFIKSLLALQAAGVDWGAYDNDGPDGMPNSGDDDGYVDFLAVIHPRAGAECTGNENSNTIWSHKWTLTDASSTRSHYETGTPSNAVGVLSIRIDDYLVQGALRCPATGTGLNDIGVFTHELGHAFGLPDLYDTRTIRHDGAGNWDLMASGSFGCNGTAPYSPCHMGAWSKAMLGWVTVDTLPPDTDLGTLTLPPVETSGIVYRVDADDGSDEYFLLENRQILPTATYDQALPSEGLLIWQIDAGVVDARWPGNIVNSFDHMGVWLRQADGLDELGATGGDRGDSGDPFPGLTGNTEFHAVSNPSATSYEGTATGLTVTDINNAMGDAIDLRILTRFTELTVTSTGTSPGASGLFTVDGVTVPDAPANFVRSAPFVPRTVEAAAGELVAPGERTPFVQWADGLTNRSRVVVTPLSDTILSASYDGQQYELRIDLAGGVAGVQPGTVQTTPPSPDLWFVPATDVSVTATAQTGFSFLGWTGALAGQPNPAVVTMSAPILAGADFELIYGVEDTVVDLVAAVPVNLQLMVQNGTSPVSWTVVSGFKPVGLVLGANGSLTGAALDMGTFALVLRATDALGLSAMAAITLDVTAPSIPIGQLGAAFLLGGQPLDSIQALFLDRQGNGDGAYDLGDFRAWVLANPLLPLSADLTPGPEPLIVTLPVRVEKPAGSR